MQKKFIKIEANIFILIFVCVFETSVVSKLRICRPPLRSGYLDVKYAQCARKNDGCKVVYHIISRLGAADIQKGRFGRPKIQLSSKMAKFAE